MQPNAKLQPRPEAGAQRTLEGIGCKLLLGGPTLAAEAALCYP
jgi:hypothetical protein